MVHAGPQRLTRCLAPTLLVAALAAGLGAASARPDAPPGQLYPENPIAALAVGRLLVAAPQVGDPNFAQTIVLLFAHSDEGAAGLIVNRPSSVPIDRVLPDLSTPATTEPQVFFGGPVAMADIRALLQAPVGSSGSRQLLPGVHLLGNREAVDAIVAEGATGDRLRLFVGYAGWGGGQLEREIRRGDWHVFDGDADIIFDAEPESLWRRQIRRTEVLAV